MEQFTVLVVETVMTLAHLATRISYKVPETTTSYEPVFYYLASLDHFT